MTTLEELLTILKGNAALSALIGDRIEPIMIEVFANGIVYTFTPLTDNSIVRTDRLEIHIVADTLSTALSIDAIVRKSLLTTGDEPLTTNIHKVNMNGGGTMEDAATGTKHLITYYYIVSNGGIKNG